MLHRFYRDYKPITGLILSFALFLVNSGCLKEQEIKSEEGLPSVVAKDQAQSQKTENPLEFVVDQANVNLTLKWSYNINLAPMGQEFKPKLYALDAIELMLDDASCSEVGSTGGSLKLQIREASITGKIIAVSETVHFPNCFYGILRFNFPSYVAVNPGYVYVMEAVHVSDNTSALFMNESPDNYLGGNFVMNGIVRPGKDLWFREGLYNFIARTKDQVKTIGWENLVRRDGTPFKNNGDCMQYINTGR